MVCDLRLRHDEKGIRFGVKLQTVNASEDNAGFNKEQYRRNDLPIAVFI